MRKEYSSLLSIFLTVLLISFKSLKLQWGVYCLFFARKVTSARFFPNLVCCLVVSLDFVASIELFILLVK